MKLNKTAALHAEFKPIVATRSVPAALMELARAEKAMMN